MSMLYVSFIYINIIRAKGEKINSLSFVIKIGDNYTITNCIQFFKVLFKNGLKKVFYEI
jgi:hypothetical protein